MNHLLTFPHIRHRTVGEGLISRQKWQWAVLGVVLIGATMSALDISIVNIALPTIRAEFGVHLSLIEWVSIAYMIVLAISLPIVGRLADIYGRSLLYNIGFGIFVLGSALCGLAPNAVFLIVARALQAIGAGLLQANSVALITQVFRSRELGRALGVQAATQATAMALGPFVGAVLVAWVGWRAIFYVNVPIGIVGGIAAHFVLPRYHPSSRRAKIDYPGIFLFTAALMGLALGVNHAETNGWDSLAVLTEMVVGITCLAAFVFAEQWTKSPTIDLGLFRHYRLIAGNVTAFLAYYALFAVLFLLPFYFEQVLGYSTLLSGVLLMPVPASMAVLAPFAGTACDRFGARNLTLAGSFMLVLGTCMLMFTSAVRHPALLVFAMAILGAGLGIFTPANNRATMAATPRDKLGVMGGLLNMMRSLGLIFGIDISGMLFIMLAQAEAGAVSTHHNASRALAILSKPAFLDGLHGVMLSLVLVGLLSALFSWFRREEDTNRPAPVHHEPIELM
ncbi:MAG TPA: MFS transporter [Acetobacteraceae bacterium]|nr:MFS transporter [Acetobacteraceae bacterium]